jgi:hypothetical protein
MKVNVVAMQTASEMKLATLQEGSLSRLFSVHYLQYLWPLQTIKSETAELRLAKRELLVNKALYLLHWTVTLPFDQCVRPMVSPYVPDCFRMIEFSKDVSMLLFYDHTNDEHEVFLSWLADPDFQLLHWLHLEKSKIFIQLRHQQQDDLDDYSDFSYDSSDDEFSTTDDPD